MRTITKEMAEKMNECRWMKFEDRYDWKSLQEKHDSGSSLSGIRSEIGMSYYTMKHAVESGLIIKHEVKRRQHTNESKSLISEKRKQWLKDNPDKHPWRNKDKFKSQPCEKVKEFLIENVISFIPEYQPEIDGRFFSIDIALPDKMIAIEINGNQHYERAGHLKPYYQERHNTLTTAGWKVYEVHYSACFNLNKLKSFFDEIEINEHKVEFDYFNYTPREKKRNSCCDCGRHISKGAIRCGECSAKHSTKNYAFPDKEALQKLLWEYPTTVLSKAYGLSDTGLSKRVKSMGLTKPPRGYWTKINSNKMNQTGFEPALTTV